MLFDLREIEKDVIKEIISNNFNVSNILEIDENKLEFFDKSLGGWTPFDDKELGCIVDGYITAIDQWNAMIKVWKTKVRYKFLKEHNIILSEDEIAFITMAKLTEVLDQSGNTLPYIE
jgi:hypothetical protein